ncbi:PucR family transcriptional regulator [Sinosporangium siamense]|uniref:PucR family transcriptional regulator n=1 Tax=Sinosporangium siamense TaxID=1367973 RepID=A0A919RK54_9ACTN|nr:helix-turn-helix domain-containing protein [Sinosporangium siamense]GII95335.1 hypothetical protein Ssi02_55660 [Sinosporangium siamense]
MASIADLLRTPSGRSLTHLGGPLDTRTLRALHLVEDVRDVTSRARDGLAMLPPRASRSTMVIGDYQLDILLRQAAAHGVRGVAIAQDSAPASSTALAIADRYAVTLLHYDDSAPVGSLVLGLAREIEGDADRAMQRLVTASAAAAELAARGGTPDEIVALIGDLVGAGLALSPADPAPAPGGFPAPVVTAAGGATATPAAALAAALAQATVREALAAARHQNEAPLRSRAAVVSELLLTTRTPDELTLERARALGIHLDGVHTVVALDVEQAETLAVGDPVREFELIEQITAAALGELHTDSPRWHGTASGTRILLARSLPPADTAAPLARPAGPVDALLERLKARFPELRFRCGVGMPHEGVQGLRRSAAEARSAVSAALSKGWIDKVVHVDEAGLRRMLLEFSASEASRALIDELLDPLDSLGPAKAKSFIETLEAYLACNGSFVETARRLYMHRNTVVYRIAKIGEALGTDFEDPDLRFALQLACRVRRLGST